MLRILFELLKSPVLQVPTNSELPSTARSEYMEIKGDDILIHSSDKFYEQTNISEMTVTDLYPDNMPVGRGCPFGIASLRFLR